MLNESDFKLLFTTHYQRLFQLSLNIIRDEGMAHDCVQEVFTKIWERKTQFMTKVPVEFYLKRAVINTSINLLKHGTKQVSLDQRVDFPDEEDIAYNMDLFKKLLESAMDTLPKKCRTIFILSRIEGLENSEIAEYLDISQKTVENQLTIALKNLKSYFDQQKERRPGLYRDLFMFFNLV